ncbi:MAG: hypothetical protein Q9186_007053 [Xanthomendoza sp. 1 TL-2023]
MADSDLRVPSGQTALRMTFSSPIVDFDQMNYVVALHRAYPDISIEDLRNSSNSRYTRQSDVGELINVLKEAERISEGGPGFFPFNARAMTEPCRFWPHDGFKEDELDKLYMLVAFRQAYEVSARVLKETTQHTITTGLPTVHEVSNLRAAKPGFLSYEDIRGTSYKALLEIYVELKKQKEEKEKAK